MTKKAMDDSVVMAVAKAIENAAIDQLHERISQRIFDHAEFEVFFKSLGDESDRAAAIISFSYLESLLSDLFKEELAENIPGGVATIVGPTGILDSVSALLRMAMALHWIKKTDYEQLDILRKIRNQFAHGHKVKDFEIEPIRGLIASLRPSEKVPLKSADFEGPLTLRQVFLIRTVIATGELVVSFYTAPVSIRMGLPPNAIFSRDFENIPKVIQEMHRSVARTILGIAGL